MRLSKLIILSSLFFLRTLALEAQSAALDSTTRFFAVPLAFYSPDTKWGGGVAGIITFPGQPFRSSVTFGFAYTQRKQILLYLPYQLFSRDTMWRVYGELGYYRYIYRYFGVGNSYANDFSENYTAKFPRIRITGVRRVRNNQYVGLRLALDDFAISKTVDEGEIASGKPTGSNGGITSAMGAVWLYDTRDNQFFPGKGMLVEASFTGEDQWTGSDFRYARFTLDASFYRTIGERHKLAVNIFTVLSSPGAPFFKMPQIGGSPRLRGYPDGKYRDHSVAMAQAEWRFPLYWRFKGVVFAGGGSVFGTKGEQLKIRPNAGLGLRFEFDKKQQLHLRFDYGFGKGRENSGAYITIGEAF